MTTCLYLPDGRVAFMYGRPKITDNKAMNAGGMKIEVVEPFKQLRVTYDGKACVLAKPFDMAEPSKAFRENPTVACRVELDYEGVSPMFGGETVQAPTASPSKSIRRSLSPRPTTSSTWPPRAVHRRRREVRGRRLRPARQELGSALLAGDQLVSLVPDEFRPRLRHDALDRRRRRTGKPRQGGMVLKDGNYDLITECAHRQRLGRERLPDRRCAPR